MPLSAVRFSADGHRLYVFDGRFRRAYDATPLPPDIEALDVADGLEPAATKEEIAAQLDKLTLAPEVRTQALAIAPLRRPALARADGFGGSGRRVGPAALGLWPKTTPASSRTNNRVKPTNACSMPP